MNKHKSKMRQWVESRLTGKLTKNQWHVLRGRFSNIQMRSLSRERALRIKDI